MFSDGILNLCKTNPKDEFSHFKIESGSFETLNKTADEGLGTTPIALFRHTVGEADKFKLRHFKEPKPARGEFNIPKSN
jgi:LysR family hydrogen peroxide-inducible transcriptional activator